MSKAFRQILVHVFLNIWSMFEHTVKPVLNGQSKIEKTKVLKTNGILMKVKSIAECSEEHSAILLTCIKR